MVTIRDMNKPTCSNSQCSYYRQQGRIVRNGKDRHGQQRWLCKHCGATFTYTPSPPPSIEPWQRKKPQKGIKSQRGQGEMYDEVKRPQTLSLTRTAVFGLDELARERGISRSELVEQVGRGIIPLPSV